MSRTSPLTPAGLMIQIEEQNLKKKATKAKGFNVMDVKAMDTLELNVLPI